MQPPDTPPQGERETSSEPKTQPWVWALVGFIVSGAAVAAFGLVDPMRASVLKLAWMLGWLAIAGLFFIAKVIRDHE